MTNLTDAQRAALERRNAEHEPVWCMVLAPDDVADLLAGIINARVRSMALWLAETEEDFLVRLARNARERKRTRRGGARR